MLTAPGERAIFSISVSEFSRAFFLKMKLIFHWIFHLLLSLEVLVQILLFIQAVRANQNLGYYKDLKGEKLLNFAKITLSLTDLFKLEKNWCCYILTSFSHHSNSTIFSEILSDLQLHMKGNYLSPSVSEKWKLEPVDVLLHKCKLVGWFSLSVLQPQPCLCFLKLKAVRIEGEDWFCHFSNQFFY